ncbi:unnamed protein product [Polarella glacialis]|uniref:SAM-dependent MTase RsmB/NOP-type domain-containing protein n=1 Tax=Polarella glacialis TaxID=89957 RepID=A0A813GB89_POLGL|nr:unnamed protein product [Polarella glacialis]
MAKAAERLCHSAAMCLRDGGASWNREVLYSSGVEHWMMAELQAIVLGARKNETLLKQITEESGLSEHLAQDHDESLLQVLLYQILLGSRRIRGEGALFDVVKEWKAPLQKTLADRRRRGDTAKFEQKIHLPRYIRVNTLRVSLEDAVCNLGESGWTLGTGPAPDKRCFVKDPVIANCIRFPPQSSFHGNAMVDNGSFILQDRSSCIPAAALAPPKGAHVIDCCAAPGNKTSHVAALLAGTGKIFAFDRNEKRCNTLRSQMEKFGVKEIEVFCQDFMHVSPTEERYANVTHFLCDPTCSGSGQLANQVSSGPAEEENQSSGWLSASDLSALAESQTSIVSHCMSFTACQVVTYSTCSVHEVENEAVVAAVLAKNPKFRAVKCLPDWEHRGTTAHGPAGPLCCRASHEADFTNGFFCCRFERIPKKGAEQGSPKQARKEQPPSKHSEAVTQDKPKKKKKKAGASSQAEAVVADDTVRKVKKVSSSQLEDASADRQKANKKISSGQPETVAAAPPKKKKKKRLAQPEAAVEVKSEATTKKRSLQVEAAADAKPKKKKKKSQ